MTTTIGRTGEPRLAATASWAVLAASFALSASTWIAMAVLAGFTDTATLPVVDVTLKVAWLMPVAVDGYVVVALVLWMSPVPASVAGFARKNTYGAAGIGIAAQSAYHLLETQSATDEVWRVALAAIVGALPPAVAALAVHMRALIRRETDRSPVATGTTPVQTAPSVSAPAPTPITVAAPTPPAVAAPSITAPPPAGEPTPTREPATKPEPVPAARTEPMPTPADVAARVTPSPTKVPLRPPADRPAPAGASKPRPRTTAPTAPVEPQAAPAADIPVNEPEPAQLSLPMPVDPALLGKAREIAEQYRADNGVPIKAGQLAARLRVNSELAAQALAVLSLGPDNPTTPIPTVNGTPVRATR